MITNYPNGQTFIEENGEFLSENKYMSSFFFFDAPLLHESSKKNYALKISDQNKRLLALKVEPYFLMLYGDKELIKDLLISNSFSFI